MDNLTRAIALLDSNPRLRVALTMVNRKHATPPKSIKETIDNIAATRGVTLYRKG